ncbi:MAG TPA: hypothetical protein VEP72_00775, partial [Microbacterium sp.]|nr:hypothetical protein [Microbacterium sp.]
MSVALALALTVAGSAVGLAATSANECGTGWSGCSAENTGSTVEVGATRPGAGSGGSDSGRGGSDAAEDPEESRPPINDCRRGSLNCYTIDTNQKPTLTDVASFAPAALPLVDEPGGVGIVGMPVNFVVDAQTHTATGELFDLPVTVRFVPTSFEFRHGDGTSRETTTGGRT